MNIKNIASVLIAAVLIVLVVGLINRGGSRSNDLSRSMDKAADNIEEGMNDAKRNVEDALD